jgi:hypothetical protein
MVLSAGCVVSCAEVTISEYKGGYSVVLTEYGDDFKEVVGGVDFNTAFTAFLSLAGFKRLEV